MGYIHPCSEPLIQKQINFLEKIITQTTDANTQRKENVLD